MSDHTNEGQDDQGKIGVRFKRTGAERQRLALSYLEPAQAQPASQLPAVITPPSLLMQLHDLFLRLWAVRKQHGVVVKPNSLWESGDRIYGNLVNFKLPLHVYRFYYVDNDQGRTVLILPTVSGNLSICYRCDGKQMRFDYMIPKGVFDHPLVGKPGDVDSEYNFIISALSDLHDRIQQPPDFKPLF